MYIIMYKYSAFRINHKSFRSSISKNFTVIPGSDRGLIYANITIQDQKYNNRKSSILRYVTGCICLSVLIRSKAGYVLEPAGKIVDFRDSHLFAYFFDR